MEVPLPVALSRRGIVSSHLQQPGVRAVAAEDDAGRLVGVAYGYLGAPGQWWHDQVREALTDAQAARWLQDSFEVCELHVRPALHGAGLGRALMAHLLDGVPARTAVLTTPDSETRARAFYRAGGWVDLVRSLRFPGDPRAFAVLGLALPSR
jgi:GNAT superfamily N-acetyltransferase